MSHDALADAVGSTSRRQTIRWLKDGHEPNGVALMRILSALGVTFTPPAPRALRSVNAELCALTEQVDRLADPRYEERRQDLLERLEGEVDRWRHLNEELAVALGQPPREDGRTEAS